MLSDIERVPDSYSVAAKRICISEDFGSHARGNVVTKTSYGLHSGKMLHRTNTNCRCAAVHITLRPTSARHPRLAPTQELSLFIKFEDFRDFGKKAA